MKKYYCISILAIAIIACLQAYYISLQYREYVSRNIAEIENDARNAIDEELNLRARKNYKPDKIGEEHLYFHIVTPKEREMAEKERKKEESIRYDSIDIQKLRKEGIASSRAEAMILLSQDFLEKEGRDININVIDTIFTRNLHHKYDHAVSLLDRNKKVIGTTLKGQIPSKWAVTKDIAVNLKAPRFIRIAIDITPSYFIKGSVWSISLSLLFVLIGIGCVGYQLTVIRNKEELLHNRELSINGTIHDLKSPLNSVVTLLDFLDTEIEEEKLKSMIEQTEDRAKALATTIETMLITARGTTKRIALKKESADLNAVTERAKKDIDILFSKKPHTIEITNKMAETTRPEVDVMYMENVMRNLMENAVKYADDGVQVFVILKNDDRNISITVSDTGWGIAKKYHKHLFEQFYRVPHQNRSKGYGIGLALVKYIVESHDGHIRVKSHVGEGSMFSITLPLT